MSKPPPNHEYNFADIKQQQARGAETPLLASRRQSYSSLHHSPLCELCVLAEVPTPHRVIHIKKGQFASPEVMVQAANKVIVRRCPLRPGLL